MHERRAPRSPVDLAVTAVFVALLLAPALLAVTKLAGPDIAFIRAHEQRAPFVAPPASRGALATGGYERDLERQIADGFPFRTRLIEAYAYVKFVWFGASTSQQVVRGSDGWLFYGKEERRYVTRSWNPGDAELARIADIFGARARLHARNGTHYVLLFAPNKSTVYANEAPAWYRPKPPTPLDRLLPMLRARGVTVVDPRGALEAATRNGEVYSRGDTHWNDAGAAVAYRAVVGAMSGAGMRDALPAGTKRAVSEPGDLLNVSGVGARFSDSVVKLDYVHRARDEPRNTVGFGGHDPAGASVRVTSVDDPKLPTAVLIGDSFSFALAPMFAESFRRMTYVELPSIDVVRNNGVMPGPKPDFVVQELVERSLVPGDDAAPP